MELANDFNYQEQLIQSIEASPPNVLDLSDGCRQVRVWWFNYKGDYSVYYHELDPSRPNEEAESHLIGVINETEVDETDMQSFYDSLLGCLTSKITTEQFTQKHAMRHLSALMGVEALPSPEETGSRLRTVANQTQQTIAEKYRSMKSFEKEFKELSGLRRGEIRSLNLWQLGGWPVKNAVDNRIYVLGQPPFQVDTDTWVVRYEATTDTWEVRSLSWPVMQGIEVYKGKYKLEILAGLNDWQTVDKDELAQIINSLAVS